MAEQSTITLGLHLSADGLKPRKIADIDVPLAITLDSRPLGDEVQAVVQVKVDERLMNVRMADALRHLADELDPRQVISKVNVPPPPRVPR